jgi:transposase InsO family protein
MRCIGHWPTATSSQGWCNHSDRGVQYCSQTYVERLQAYGFVIGMSRTGNPYD